MSIEFFVYKTLRFLILIVAIIFLFLKYFAFPSMVAVFFNSKNLPEGYLPKSQFFYLITFVLLAINLLTPLLINLMKNFLKSSSKQIFNLFDKSINKEYIFQNFENWINLLIAALNTLIFLAILIIARLNATEYTDSVSNYAWFAKFIFALMLVIFIYPFSKIFFYKTPNISNSNATN
jgi:uncharacterized membrane protein